MWVWRWQSGIVSVIVYCSGCTYWCTVQYGTDQQGPQLLQHELQQSCTFLHSRLNHTCTASLRCSFGSLMFMFGKIRIRKFLTPNNYILMATSMKCDNILIMNNSCNWLGRTQEDTRLHPAIIIMHTGVSLTNNILVFRFRYNVGLRQHSSNNVHREKREEKLIV